MIGNRIGDGLKKLAIILVITGVVIGTAIAVPVTLMLYK